MADFIKVQAREFGAAVEHWKTLKQDAKGFYLDVAEDTAQFLLLALRDAVASAQPVEWRAGMAEAHVGRSDRGVGIVFPHELHDLEYGNTEAGQRPHPMIRRTINHEQHRVHDRFSNIAHQRFGRVD